MKKKTLWGYGSWEQLLNSHVLILVTAWHILVKSLLLG